MKNIKKNKMKNLNNCHQKKLEGMSLALATQEKNTNTVMDLYNKAIIIEMNKIIALVI